MSERYSRCETCGGSVCECTAEEIIKAALAKNPKLTPEQFIAPLAAMEFGGAVKKGLLAMMQAEIDLVDKTARAAAFGEAAEICEDYAMTATETAANEMAGNLKYSMQSRAKEILETINQK